MRALRIRQLLAGGFLALALAGCESAFAPPTLSQPTPDGDNDGDSEIQTYRVVVRPDYAYQGTTFSGGTLSFKAADLPAIRDTLAKGDPSRQSYEIDYGPGVNFLLVRFDADALAFKDLRGVVSATARTGEHTVRVRITYGEVSVVEYGRFYVLPPQDVANKPTALGVR